MENLDDIKVKSKIITILEHYDEISSDNGTNEIVEKIQMFVENMKMFSKNLIALIEEMAEVTDTINTSKKTTCEFKNSKDIISYSKYIELSIPLYIIHFIKNSNYAKIPKNISITNYNNLVKENRYKLLRQCNQIILLWKTMSNGHYIVLSVILSNINEINFYQKLFFLSHVGGSNLQECKYYWNMFNKVTVDKLINKNRLLSFREAIYNLISKDNYHNIDF